MSPRHPSYPNLSVVSAVAESTVVMCAGGHAGVERLAEGEHPGPCLEHGCGLSRERMPEPSNAQLFVQVVAQRRDFNTHREEDRNGFALILAKTNTQTLILAAIGLLATIVAAFR